MYLYCLNIMPSDNAGEGENWDEWFNSLAKAKQQRAEYIREYEGYCAGDFGIDKVSVPKLPLKKMLLATLNQQYKGWDKTPVIKEWKTK